MNKEQICKHFHNALDKCIIGVPTRLHFPTLGYKHFDLNSCLDRGWFSYNYKTTPVRFQLGELESIGGYLCRDNDANIIQSNCIRTITKYHNAYDVEFI